LEALALSSAPLIVFVLVLIRTSGLVILAPVYGTAEVPPQVRALLAVALAVLVFPLQTQQVLVLPDTMLGLALAAGGELLVGLVMGMAINVLFSGMQLAGQVIAQSSGMALSEVFNPALETNLPVFSHLLHLFALAIYAVAGGHRLLMAGLLNTFAALPPGQVGLPTFVGELLLTLLSQSCSLAVAVAAPATAALLLASLVLGMVSRALPQLNVLSFGFGLNALVTFGVLAITLGSMAWVFQDHLEATLELLGEVWRDPSLLGAAP
jgi:flagellar biosynthetic protein FliR